MRRLELALYFSFARLYLPKVTFQIRSISCSTSRKRMKIFSYGGHKTFILCLDLSAVRRMGWIEDSALDRCEMGSAPKQTPREL